MTLFNKNDYSTDIKEIDFNFHFYTNFYFKNKSANIAEFSNVMGVSGSGGKVYISMVSQQ